jgi:hypothetical protein
MPSGKKKIGVDRDSYNGGIVRLVEYANDLPMNTNSN